MLHTKVRNGAMSALKMVMEEDELQCTILTKMYSVMLFCCSEQREAEGRGEAGWGPGGGAEERRVGDGVRRPLEPAVCQRRLQGARLWQRQGGSDRSPHGTRWGGSCSVTHLGNNHPPLKIHFNKEVLVFPTMSGTELHLTSASLTSKPQQF